MTMKIRLSDLPRDLTVQEIEGIASAETRGTTPDEECPEMTQEQLSQLHSVKQISSRPLSMMDESIHNVRKGIVSAPADLSEFKFKPYGTLR